MTNIAKLLICSIVFIHMSSFAAENSNKNRTYNIQQCVDIALKNHPTIVAAKNSITVGEGRVGEARSGYYPQISASGSYSRVSPVSGSTSSKLYNGQYNQYSAGLALDQTIFDFWKTPTQVNIQKHNLEAARADYEASSEQVIFNVKSAYYVLLQAIRNREVAAETVEQYRQHFEQAKGFYEVRLKPRFDVIKAEVDLSNARLNLIKSENAIKTARVNLNNALGQPDNSIISIEDNLAYEKSTLQLENLLDMAFKNRADYKALRAKTKAADENITYAATGFLPVLSGSASYNWSGTELPLGQGWSAGVSVSVPLFSGFLTANQIKEARANLNIAKANEASLRQQIIYDVEQSIIQIREAQESIPAAELTVNQAKENLDLANGRYQAGVGNPIEVADAQTSYLNAKTTYIQALVNYRIAQASLEKAIGVKQ